MGLIIDLWERGTAPAIDGLYRADGSAYSVDLDGPGLSRFELGLPIDLDVLLVSDPEDVIEIDVSTEVTLLDGSGFLCCGEGALGSEGFFARLDQVRGLVWVFSSRKSNPFYRIDLNAQYATFVNNHGNSVMVDLNTSIYRL